MRIFLNNFRYANLITMRVKCCLPLSIVEKEAFKAYVYTLEPSFKMPTRKTIKENGVPELKDHVSINVENLFKTIEYPNISVDGWSDDTLRSFNGYICQGIDVEWDLKVIPVAFELFKGNSKVALNL
jgi:hypothetical protein